jgi:hypothetical protein
MAVRLLHDYAGSAWTLSLGLHCRQPTSQIRGLARDYRKWIAVSWHAYEQGPLGQVWVKSGGDWLMDRE